MLVGSNLLRPWFIASGGPAQVSIYVAAGQKRPQAIQEEADESHMTRPMFPVSNDWGTSLSQAGEGGFPVNQETLCR